MNKIYVVSLLLLCSINYAIHLEMHTDATSYLSKLKQQQQSFQSGIEKLRADASNTKSSLNSETDIDAKIKLLESSIVRQKK